MAQAALLPGGTASQRADFRFWRCRNVQAPEGCGMEGSGCTVKFFLGCHQPSDALKLSPVCISINRIRERKSTFPVGEWMMDSGAFTEISTHGRYRYSVKEYADNARRWITNGNLQAIVAQDYMCEPFILKKTGLSIVDHQRLTIERYDALLAETLPVHVMPVLQGFAPSDYANHVRQYSHRLMPEMWVGVGSVCKRQGDPSLTARVLSAILDIRPDLRLHGFGVKLSSLQSEAVRSKLFSADSMAWSFSARKQGRNANHWCEANKFRERVMSGNRIVGYWQTELPL
jgi:hypothetical protein